MQIITFTPTKSPWNKGKIVGQKLPFRSKQICAIRTRLEIAHNIRDLALFNLAIDSKLRGCDLVKLKIRDISHGSQISSRGIIKQQKTQQSVQFEITEQTRKSLSALIKDIDLTSDDYIFKSRLRASEHLSTRQYARIVKSWACSIDLDPTEYATHSMRRSKVSIIYSTNKNIRAIQLLLGHRNLESTVRYLGVELDDALIMAENIEI